MSLCINPYCLQPQNSDNQLFCQGCGSELLLEGRYRVVRLLGSGGFSKTFEVSEPNGTLNVLKVLTDPQPKAVELFEREAAVLSQLQHPGIPKVEPDGYFIYWSRDSKQPLHCLVMEKIEGLNLHEYIQQRGNRAIEQKMAVQWLKELVTILRQVHSQNFFHRDIKPSNIMLRANGELVLIDFGTARQVTETYMAKRAGGQVTGIVSAGYTPPEQINGQAVQQSDFYALGRTFVYLLTAKDPGEFYDPQTNDLRWREYAPAISPSFADLIDRLIARLPSQRPQTTEAILQQLAEISDASHSTVLNPPNSRQRSVPQTLPPNPPKPVSSAGWRLWLQWVLMNSVGWSGGAVLGWLAVTVASRFAIGNLVEFTIFGLVLGASVGIMQWLVLRQRVPQASWWVLATAVGIAFGGAVGAIFGSSMGAAVLGVISMGILQWLVLRRRVRRASWWMWVMVVGLGAGLGASQFLGLPLVSLWGVVLGLPVIGAVTGGVLVWLLRRPVSGV